MHNYKMPYPFKPGKVAVGKEVRGGESESCPPESTILTRTPEHRQAKGNKFHGFKQRGKI